MQLVKPGVRKDLAGSLAGGRLSYPHPDMQADVQQIGILGEGARVAALIQAWLRRGGTGPAGLPGLTWLVEGELDVHARARALERACVLAGRSHAVEPVAGGGQAELMIEGQTLRLARPDQVELAATIELRDADTRLLLAGGRAQVIEPAAALACLALIRAIERGPGLRWLLLAVLLDRGDAHQGLVELEGRALARSLESRLPSVAGRLSLALTRGPQSGARIELIVQTNSSGSGAAGIGDVLEILARAPASAPGLRLCSELHEGAAVIGDERVWVARELGGVGPLARVLMYFDPLALEAGVTWSRVLDQLAKREHPRDKEA